MYHSIDPSYFGSYQLVSEPVNPNQRIQQHYAQYQQPLASPTFVPWQLPYPEVDPYQQQQTTHCQQYNFRSDSVFNFESGSKSEPRSREFANSFKCSVGRVTCCTSAIISAADMSFIRDLLQQMIVSTDRIQASLEKMNLLLSESSKMFTDSFPWAVKSSKLQYADVVACPKSFVRTISASDPAPSEKDVEVKKPKKDKIPKLLLLPLKKLAADAKAKQHVAAAPKAKTPVNANQVHHYINIYYFKFGSIDSINKLLGNFFGIISKQNAYVMFDIMLERNEKKILKNMMFIFDPGGSGYLKVNASLQPQFDSSSFSLLDQYYQYLEDQHISAAIWYIQGFVLQVKQCVSLFFYHEQFQTFYLLSVCDYKTASQYVDRLDVAMKANLQKVQIIKELNQEFDYVNPSFSKTNLQCEQMLTLSHKKEELQKQFNNATDFSPCDYDFCLEDQLFLAPPLLDGEWLPKSVMYAPVELMTVTLGHPKDGTTEMDLQHSAIWMVGLYLMPLMQFLENKVAVELTYSEFVEAQQALVQATVKFVGENANYTAYIYEWDGLFHTKPLLYRLLHIKPLQYRLLHGLHMLLCSSSVALYYVRSWGQDRFQGDGNVRYLCDMCLILSN